jgi:hypothetical protein
MSAKSNSNAAHKGKEPLFSRAGAEVMSPPVAVDTVGAAHPLRSIQGQRIEQMYLLADIFLAIFEALPAEYEDAIATKREAA